MAARGRTTKALVHAFDDGRLQRRPDELIAEEPMTIRLDGHQVATTMRTPGHDFELAVGFCHGEGLLGGHPVLSCRYCSDDTGGGRISASSSEFNVVNVDTGGRAPVPTARLGTVTSSCGWCGSTLLDDLAARFGPLPARGLPDLAVLGALAEHVRAMQPLFERTGAAHGAAAFDASGAPLVVREDIGRHNAVDKVVGHLLLSGRLPATGLGLFVSSRASFELVQKAWAAGFSSLVSVGAPSSLAVSTARVAGLVLVGFVRQRSLVLYAPEQVPGGGGPVGSPA